MAEQAPEKPKVRRRERWSSRLGFIAAAIGSAVGLGNIWRFPYVAGENGGGSFLVAYVAAIVLLGVPLMMAELAAGRRYQGGAIGTLRAVAPHAGPAGCYLALAGFLLLSYYLVITGWTLGYAGMTLAGVESDFATFSTSWVPTALYVVVAAVTVTIVLAGVRGGVERTSRLLLPLLGLTVLGLALYGLSLPGRTEALTFLFRPQLSALLEPRTWAVAVGQAFFSLSVGMGVLITFGSYMDRATPVRDSAAVVSIADTSISMLAGLAVFPVVFTFGLAAAAGPQLAFVSLPAAFDQMTAGRAIGSAFYVLLFVAALTSAVSLLEMASASAADWRGWPRRRSVLVVFVPLLLAGLPSALSYSPMGLEIGGAPVLDVLDETVGTYGLLLGGLVTSVALFWVGDPTVITREIGAGAAGRLEKAFILVGRFLVPGVLLGAMIGLAVAG